MVLKLIKEFFINQVVNRLPSFSDSYQTNPIDQLVFNYIIRDGEPNDETRKLVNNREENTGSNFRIGDLNLPVSMLASDYGEILNKGILSDDNITRFTIKNKHNQIIIMDTYETENKNICEQIGSSNIKWVDTQLENNIIKREVLGKGSKIFYFQDNKTIFK